MKLTRQQLDTLLVDYLYDELDEETARQFEAALEHDPELQAEVTAHQRTRSLMGRLEDEPLPAGLLDAVMLEARQTMTEPVEAVSWWSRMVAALLQPAVSTMLVFAVLATTGVFLVRQEAEAPAEPVPTIALATPTPDEVEAPAAEDVALVPPPAGAAASDDEAKDESRNEIPPAMRRAAEPAIPAVVASAEQGNRAGRYGNRKLRKAKMKAVGKGTVSRLVELDDGETVADAWPPAGSVRREAAPQSARPSKPISTAGSKMASRARGPAVPEVVAQTATEASTRRDVRLKLAERGQARRASQAPSAAPPSPPDQRPSRDADEAEQAEELAETSKKKQADEARTSPWKAAEKEVAREKGTKAKAKAWLVIARRFEVQGNRALADRALSNLQRIRGYEKLARTKRKALAKRADEGGGPSKVPSKSYSAPERSREATEPARAKPASKR